MKSLDQKTLTDIRAQQMCYKSTRALYRPVMFLHDQKAFHPAVFTLGDSPCAVCAVVALLKEQEWQLECKDWSSPSCSSLLRSSCSCGLSLVRYQYVVRKDGKIATPLFPYGLYTVSNICSQPTAEPGDLKLKHDLHDSDAKHHCIRSQLLSIWRSLVIDSIIRSSTPVTSTQSTSSQSTSSLTPSPQSSSPLTPSSQSSSPITTSQSTSPFPPAPK